MPNVDLVHKTVSDDGTIDRELVATIHYVEMARQRINLAPGVAAVSLTEMLSQLGVTSKVRALSITSDVDGVVVNVTTTAAQTAVLGCYPLFFTSLAAGIDASSPFAMTVELPVGEMTAHIDIIALG